MRARRGESGFSLIEIMAALAIVGGSLYILLGSQLTAMWLFASADEAVMRRSLLELAVGRSEVEIYAGNLTGDEEFGPRYEGYRYAWDAQLGADDQIALYTVNVTITGPEEFTEGIVYMFYDVRY